jgi:hypothetical protein
VEGDIQACFDEIDHAALLGRVRQRIADKRVLALVKAFCKAGILNQDGGVRDTITGTHKAASCHRCWPASPWACSTSTSPGARRPPQPSGDAGSPAFG